MIIPRTEELVARTEGIVNEIAARYVRNCSYYTSNGYCRSSFSRWGRWVLAGVLIAVGILLFLIFACLAQRRRRKQRRLATSQTPMTAPANNNYYGGGAPQQQQTYNAPPGPPPPNYGGANEGYYGQQNGIAQPQGAYVK